MTDDQASGAATIDETPTEVAIRRMCELRKERRLSGAAVARRMTELGIPWDRNTVAKLETGRRSLSIDELLALATALCVSPADLLPQLGQRVASPIESELAALRVDVARIAAHIGVPQP